MIPVADEEPRGPPPGVPEIVWTPKNPENSRISEFCKRLGARFNGEVPNSQKLYEWSVTDVAGFWHELAAAASDPSFNSGSQLSLPQSMVAATGNGVVDTSISIDHRPRWFKNTCFNYAETLLSAGLRHPEDIALIWTSEEAVTAHSLFLDGTSGLAFAKQMTFGELHQQVRDAASALSSAGVGCGSVVAAYAGNCPEVVVLALASAWIGAVFTTIAPDLGADAAIARLEQTSPAVVLASSSIFYNGRKHDMLERVSRISKALDSQTRILLVGDAVSSSGFDTWIDFVSRTDEDVPEPLQLPFEHPLYVLYSSGTTGKPKCIVHSAGGVLLQHWKEHALHGDTCRGDRLLQYTSVGWMMWHWAIGALSTAASIILYEGSPLRPCPLVLPRLCKALGATHLGVSAKYIQHLQTVAPRPHSLNHSSLRTIYSTGSPLSQSGFVYASSILIPGVQVASISGGTDIVSLFAGGDPTRAVHAGELQHACLGMCIMAYSEDGIQVADGRSGELVCTKPFPCMPIFFWADLSSMNSGSNTKSMLLDWMGMGSFSDPNIVEQINRSRLAPFYASVRPSDCSVRPGPQYQAAYFTKYPGTWYHGDHVRFNPATSGVVFLGRSDGVLNPAGVRFGSAELYAVIEDRFSSIIKDSLAIGVPDVTGDESVILFVDLGSAATNYDSSLDTGALSFATSISPDLIHEIKSAIRSALSARHVPALILACPAIPHTINGKKLEVPVKRILSSIANPEKSCQSSSDIARLTEQSTSSASISAANPKDLDFFRSLPICQLLQRQH